MSLGGPQEERELSRTRRQTGNAQRDVVAFCADLFGDDSRSHQKGEDLAAQAETEGSLKKSCKGKEHQDDTSSTRGAEKPQNRC